LGHTASRFVRRWLAAYEATEPDASRFRAAQMNAVLDLTPVAMSINVVNAAVVVIVAGDGDIRDFLLPWAGVVLLFATLGLRGWLRARQRPHKDGASEKVLRRATLQAAALAGVWGAMPVVALPVVASGAQFVIGMVTTGMICAGGFALSSIPAAATAWTLILSIAGAVAIGRSVMPYAAALTTLLLVYAAIVVYSARTSSRTLGARLMAEAQAARQHEVIGLLLRDFEDHASDLLWEVDCHGRFVHVSSRLAAVFGTDTGNLARRRAIRLTGARIPRTDEADQCWRNLHRHFVDGLAFRDLPLAMESVDGVRWWSLSARPLVADGLVAGWRGVAADVTEKHLAHRRLAWLAHNDALTGLVNRTQFRELLQALLQQADGATAELAVVYVDLDAFKQVNDHWGHAAGDQLLQGLGERLLSVARRSDTVARLSGDEFAILIRGVADASAAVPVLDRLREALVRPVVVGTRPVSLRASLGVAIAPTDGCDVDTLMSHADIALYTAKRAGGDRYCFFRQEMGDVSRRRLGLEAALRGALDRGEFYLVYQPQVDTESGALRGFEALLRWRHPEYGEVSPVEFIPLAEGAGLMTGIGAWVLDEACRQAGDWPSELQVGVNVSPVQLHDPAFAERVLASLGTLPAARLELEVTESALLEDGDGVAKTFGTLRESGIKLALDDFGTGFSALSYLRRFPFDVLKIDRSFIRDLGSNSEALVIVDTILAMARAFGMATVAEGVESAAEVSLLRSRGCRRLQGYLVGMPMPAAEIEGFRRSWRSDGVAILSGVDVSRRAVSAYSRSR